MLAFFAHNFTTFLDHVGTFAFAISGIRSASAKKFDWFGAYVVGLVTAIGGGTTRDLLLGITPFWMTNASYLVVTAVALVVFIFFHQPLHRLTKTLFLFDTIGLGLFVVVGLEKSLVAGFSFWVAIIMGMITGSIGGVIRDLLVSETPLLFRRDIYALACIAGGLMYWICSQFHLPTIVLNILAATTVILIRIIAVKFHIQMPLLHTEEYEKRL